MSKEQTPIGYLFNGRFYKTIDDLRGRTMAENNQPQPLFTEKQTNDKVLEALERETPKIWKLSRETFWNHPNGRNMTGEHYYKTELKPSYEQ